ncbi:hypothetical protein [Methylobacterium sp. WL6]|uniref:hypothetical protein n=1 Tax=Methylobacterium sp. WL6 TaxID=2603901 RepID=UPI0011C8ADD5|nr:hypothetical protein [Methylobacterium sp. WL6]TXN67268.1 hypothetical protein FV230_14495 [Methylobacterium sp. WL6]
MNLTLARVRAALVILAGLACGPVPAVALDRGPPAQNLGAGSTVFGGLLCAAGKTCDVSGMSVTALGAANATPTALSTLFSDAGRSALFGIKCDASITSDGRVITGSGTDNTAAINAMMAVMTEAQLPPGRCRIKGQISIPPNKTLRGASNTGTVLVVGTDFNQSASGVIKFNSSGVANSSGVKLADIGVDFDQPDTGVRANLNQYPPAIQATGSLGGWTIDRVRVSHAIKTLDMKGEQGQSKIPLLETSFFEMGLDIDGARDSVNIGTLRFWTYGFTPAQYQILIDGNTTVNSGQGMIGLNSGRMDGLIIDSFFSIFYPNAMRFYYSTGYQGAAGFQGATTATITKMQLDTTGGLKCEICDLAISSAYINIAYYGYSAIIQQGGKINIGQLNIEQYGFNLPNEVPPPAQKEGPLVWITNLQDSTKFTASGVTIVQKTGDRTAIQVENVNGSQATPLVNIAGLGITKDNGPVYTRDVLYIPGARGSIVGLDINPITAGSGTLLDAPNDIPFTVITSAVSGWTNKLVQNPTKLNVNFMSQNVKAAMFGANGATPVGKCTLSAALPTDGSATNAAIAAAINTLRSCGLTNGLAQ